MAEKWREIADRVWVRRHRSLDLNVGAVACDGGMLIVDTRANRAQGRDLAASLRQISRLPVRWVINTHHHWDHTFGNQAFPDAAIWGHERCAAALVEHGEQMRQEVKRLAPDLAEAMDEVVVTPPGFTFSNRATVSLGGVPVEMLHPGRGHTDNDIVISLTGKGVLFAGDLIEEGAPPAFGDSFPLDWPSSLEAVVPLAGGVVVPGHGDTVDAEFVATQQEELRVVARLARERHASGMTPQQAAAGGGPYSPEVLTDAFTRAWSQLEVADAGA